MLVTVWEITGEGERSEVERTTWLHSIPSAKGSRFSRCEFQMELGKVRYDGIKEAKAKRIWRFTAKCLALATHHYFEGFAVHLTFTNLQILATNLTFTFRFKGHSSDIFHCLMFWAFQLTRAFGGRRVGISKRKPPPQTRTMLSHRNSMALRGTFRQSPNPLQPPWCAVGRGARDPQ